ncbi:Oidioi.mRNA.OKI2018_I69.chr2.g5701.t1.cds [Oikopleura dioica]|uniref:Oidioi.mRNA.OKI2018_I69.chr2.g5701.t1.cds n=1 Tax=Oikopleura dioica TaxID=34765 RepID=A0ABN7T733_OIKDI|nr:Oidioi.mRNA.OKI2018_I69.chr2.g5701.t1.cds [Oikopleura dioica]
MKNKPVKGTINFAQTDDQAFNGTFWTYWSNYLTLGKAGMNGYYRFRSRWISANFMIATGLCLAVLASYSENYQLTSILAGIAVCLLAYFFEAINRRSVPGSLKIIDTDEEKLDGPVPSAGVLSIRQSTRDDDLNNFDFAYGLFLLGVILEAAVLYHFYEEEKIFNILCVLLTTMNLLLFINAINEPNATTESFEEKLSQKLSMAPYCPIPSAGSTCSRKETSKKAKGDLDQPNPSANPPPQPVVEYEDYEYEPAQQPPTQTHPQPLPQPTVQPTAAEEEYEYDEEITQSIQAPVPQPVQTNVQAVVEEEYEYEEQEPIQAFQAPVQPSAQKPVVQQTAPEQEYDYEQYEPLPGPRANSPEPSELEIIHEDSILDTSAVERVPTFEANQMEEYLANNELARDIMETGSQQTLTGVQNSPMKKKSSVFSRIYSKLSRKNSKASSKASKALIPETIETAPDVAGEIEYDYEEEPVFQGDQGQHEPTIEYEDRNVEPEKIKIIETEKDFSSLAITQQKQEQEIEYEYEDEEPEAAPFAQADDQLMGEYHEYEALLSVKAENAAQAIEKLTTVESITSLQYLKSADGGEEYYEATVRMNAGSQDAVLKDIGGVASVYSVKSLNQTGEEIIVAKTAPVGDYYHTPKSILKSPSSDSLGKTASRVSFSPQESEIIEYPMEEIEAEARHVVATIPYDEYEYEEEEEPLQEKSESALKKVGSDYVAAVEATGRSRESAFRNLSKLSSINDLKRVDDTLPKPVIPGEAEKGYSYDEEYVVSAEVSHKRKSQAVRAFNSMANPDYVKALPLPTVKEPEPEEYYEYQATLQVEADSRPELEKKISSITNIETLDKTRTLKVEDAYYDVEEYEATVHVLGHSENELQEGLRDIGEITAIQKATERKKSEDLVEFAKRSLTDILDKSPPEAVVTNSNSTIASEYYDAEESFQVKNAPHHTPTTFLNQKEFVPSSEDEYISVSSDIRDEVQSTAFHAFTQNESSTDFWEKMPTSSLSFNLSSNDVTPSHSLTSYVPSSEAINIPKEGILRNVEDPVEMKEAGTATSVTLLRRRVVSKSTVMEEIDNDSPNFLNQPQSQPRSEPTSIGRRITNFLTRSPTKTVSAESSQPDGQIKHSFGITSVPKTASLAVGTESITPTTVDNSTSHHAQELSTTGTSAANLSVEETASASVMAKTATLTTGAGPDEPTSLVDVETYANTDATLPEDLKPGTSARPETDIDSFYSYSATSPDPTFSQQQPITSIQDSPPVSAAPKLVNEEEYYSEEEIVPVQVPAAKKPVNYEYSYSLNLSQEIRQVQANPAPPPAQNQLIDEEEYYLEEEAVPVQVQAAQQPVYDEYSYSASQEIRQIQDNGTPQSSQSQSDGITPEIPMPTKVPSKPEIGRNFEAASKSSTKNQSVSAVSQATLWPAKADMGTSPAKNQTRDFGHDTSRRNFAQAEEGTGSDRPFARSAGVLSVPTTVEKKVETHPDLSVDDQETLEDLQIGVLYHNSPLQTLPLRAKYLLNRENWSVDKMRRQWPELATEGLIAALEETGIVIENSKRFKEITVYRKDPTWWSDLRFQVREKFKSVGWGAETLALRRPARMPEYLFLFAAQYGDIIEETEDGLIKVSEKEPDWYQRLPFGLKDALNESGVTSEKLLKNKLTDLEGALLQLIRNYGVLISFDEHGLISVRSRLPDWWAMIRDALQKNQLLQFTSDRNYFRGP